MADPWTLDEALALCRSIEQYAPEYGCHVALTGGVLYKDGPRKDLDLVFYRIREEDLDIEGLFASLFWHLGIRRKTPDDVWCVKATLKGRDIDCFFPEAEEGDYRPGDHGAVADADDVLEDEARAEVRRDDRDF